MQAYFVPIPEPSESERSPKGGRARTQITQALDRALGLVGAPCIVAITAEHAHLFTPVPKDGNTYIVQDPKRPRVHHMVYPDGHHVVLDGKQTNRCTRPIAPPAFQAPSAQPSPIPPALAQQLVRAREMKQALEVLFPQGATQTSYVAQLVAEGNLPKSVFIPSGKWKVGTTLKVCFHSDAGQDAKQKIAQHAREWSKYGEIYLDFGKAPDFNFCDFNDGAQIRISFRQKGYFSLIGNEAMLTDRTNGVTMGLQDLDRGR